MELLTTAKVAEQYGVSPATIRNWVRKGILGFVEVGSHAGRQRRAIRFTREEIEKHLQPIKTDLCDVDEEHSRSKWIPSELMTIAKSQNSERKTYLIRDKDWNLKIGQSYGIALRVASVQSNHANVIALIGLIDKDCERELHQRFAHLRIRGEWFFFDDAILDAFNVPEKLRQR